MNVLGFDFGLKYIGVAAGQSVTGTASPVKTLNAKDGNPIWAEVIALIHAWKPEKLLVGVPLNMDGTEQPMTERARQFAQVLQTKTQLPVIEVDERLSTWEAKQRVFAKSKFKIQRSLSSGHPNAKAIQQVNAESAVVLVEQWFRDFA